MYYSLSGIKTWKSWYILKSGFTFFFFFVIYFLTVCFNRSATQRNEKPPDIPTYMCASFQNLQKQHWETGICQKWDRQTPGLKLCVSEVSCALSVMELELGSSLILSLLGNQKQQQLNDGAQRQLQHVWGAAGLRQSCDTKAHEWSWTLLQVLEIKRSLK